jgi:hypothetical protein
MDRRIASLLASGMLCAASLLLGAGPASGTASHNPIGHVDSVLYDIKYQAIDVAGWAGDPDAGIAPIRVHVYLDGRGAASVGTGLNRPDVAKAFPALGAHAGFYATPVQPPGRGNHTVCVYAINTGPGGNTPLGCRTVVVPEPGRVIGNIDSISVDPSDSAQRIAKGWVLDPYDAQSPTPFALVQNPLSDNVGGTIPGQSAGLARPDVDRVYPRNGHNHGFAIRFWATDVNWAVGDKVCLAVNTWVPGWETPTTYCTTYQG